VYALRPVARGTTLVVWGGEVLSQAELRARPPGLVSVTLQVDEDAYLVSTEPGPADWVNHSCDPNAGLSGQISLIAMRDIAPGEEVCFDYAMSDGSDYDEFDCACGTAWCLGRIQGTDWMNPELIERYRGYFSPYLYRRIELAPLAATAVARQARWHP
jgi:hypothetical protein